jgi:TP901 family phage tail tape measure protein
MPAKGSKIILEVDAQTAKAIQNISKFQNTATSGFKNVNKVADRLKKTLVAVGTGLVAAKISSELRKTAKAAAEFSLNIAEIETILPGGQKTTKELRDELFKLQRQFGGKAEAQAKAFYQTVSAGITDAAQAAEVLRVSNQTAIAGIGELAPTVDVLTSILNTYGLENLSAQKASDLLFTTIKNGKTTLSELSQFIGKALPNASRLGVNFSELTASIATLTTRGIDTAKASTQLTRLFGAIANGQDRAATLGPKVAAAFDLQALRSKGLVVFLKELRDALGDNEAAVQDLLGSNEAASAFTVLTAGNFQKLTDSLQDNANSAGATEAAFTRVFSELAKQAEVFVGLAEQIRIEVGEDLFSGFDLKGLNDNIKQNIPGIVDSLSRLTKVFIVAFGAIGNVVLEVIQILSINFLNLEFFLDSIAEKLASVNLPDKPSLGLFDEAQFASLTPEIKKLAESTADLSSITDESVRKIAERYREYTRELTVATEAERLFKEEGVKGREEIVKSADQLRNLIDGLQDFSLQNEVSLEVDLDKNSAKKEFRDTVNELKNDAKRLKIPLEFGDIDQSAINIISTGAQETLKTTTEEIEKQISGIGKIKELSEANIFSRLYNIGVLSEFTDESERLIEIIKTLKDPTTGKPLFSPDAAKRFTEQLKNGSQEAAKAYNETIKSTLTSLGSLLGIISSGAKQQKDPQEAFDASISETNDKIGELQKELVKSQQESDKRVSELNEEFFKSQSQDERDRILERIADAQEEPNAIVEQISELRNESKLNAVNAKKEAEKQNEKNIKETAGSFVTAAGSLAADAFLPGLGQVVGPLLDLAQQDPEQIAEFITAVTDAIPVIIEGIANNIDIIAEALIVGLVKASIIISAKLVGFVLNGIKAGLDAFFGTFIPNLLNGLGEFLQGFGEAILSIPGAILTAIFDGAREIARRIGEAVGIDGEGENIFVGETSIFAKTQRFLGFNDGGIVKAQNGFLVPGTGARDKVPILASPGEIVLPVSASRDFKSVVSEISKQSVGGSSPAGDQNIMVQLTIGEDVLAEQILRINQDNQRVS